MISKPKKHRKKPRSANKIGRNKAKCEQYRREGRRDKNKQRRLRRILRGFRGPNTRDMH